MTRPRRTPARADELATVTSRRWLPLLTLCALLLFAGVGGALAWRQYRDAQRVDLRDARAKAVVAAAVFDTAFTGQIATLRSVSQAPVVVNSNRVGMLAYFKRVQPKLFTGGVAWIDREGKVRVSTQRPQARAGRRRVRPRLLQSRRATAADSRSSARVSRHAGAASMSS